MSDVPGTKQFIAVITVDDERPIIFAVGSIYPRIKAERAGDDVVERLRDAGMRARASVRPIISGDASIDMLVEWVREWRG
jgi:hypothetical protein